LTSRVEDVEKASLAVDHHLLAIRILLHVKMSVSFDDV
jgi:hypothetical protein